MIRALLSIFIVLLSFSQARASYEITDNDKLPFVGDDLHTLKDESRRLSIHDVLKVSEWKSTEKNVPNLGISPAAFWLKITVLNNSSQSLFRLALMQPNLDTVEFYQVVDGRVVSVLKTGEYVPITERQFKDQNHTFNIELGQGGEATIYMRVQSGEQILVPIVISGMERVAERLNTENFVSGLYGGVILVMFLYNLFIFFLVKDRVYLYYVLYILFVGLVQLDLQGFLYRFIWPSISLLPRFTVYVFPILVGLASMQFMRNFLNTKEYVSRLDRGFVVFYGFYGICTILLLLQRFQDCWNLINFSAGATSMYMLYTAWRVRRINPRQADIFLLAWSIFLAGVVVYVLRNYNVLPFNNITYYIMQVGSGLETVILSFALADRINVLKKEKEASQTRALSALRENERIIKQQNVLLEDKVQERTLELEETNRELQQTFNNLKKAQSQLVSAEKMASLGQLTAGIAHEINNPINFVQSNVEPLKNDFEDLRQLISKYERLEESSEKDEAVKDISSFKEEIDFEYLKEEIEELLEGMAEGARRTTEIVKGLRNFSRLDESDLKLASINECLESTVTILKNALRNCDLELQLGELPRINCYPGKLNQLFMNIITNASQAIEEATDKPDDFSGLIKVSTSMDEGMVNVIIEDNGKGMPKEVSQKIFDPFFTTKDVGKGTGLGLSIGFSIIESHKGHIEVDSEPGVGTKFIIQIPTDL